MLTKKIIKIKIEQLSLDKNTNYILLLKNKKKIEASKKTIGKNFFNKNNTLFFYATKFSSDLSLSFCYRPTVLIDCLLKYKRRHQKIILVRWHKHLLTPGQALLTSTDTLYTRLKNLTEPHKKFCWIIRKHISTN